MADKPLVKPRWATNDVVDGTTLLNNVIEPPEAKKDSGFNYLEKPARNYVNWLGRQTNLFIDYFEQELDHFAPHAQAAPNMTIEIDHGRINGIIKAAQTTTGFVAPAGNPRRDRISIDAATGIYAVTAGAEAASPIAPALPVGHLHVCQILLYVGMTEITDDDIDVKERGIETLLAGGSITGSLNLEAQDAGAIGLSFFNTDTGNTATDGLFIGITSAEIAQFWNFENTDFQIATNNLERLKVEADGSVHVGTGLTGQGVGTINAKNGVYANDIKLYPPTVVTDYVGVQNLTLFNDTTNDLTGVNNILSASAWASATYNDIGPTGSGATNIWTALDALPSTARFAILHITNQVTAIATGTWCGVYMTALPYGASTNVFASVNRISAARFYSGSGSASEGTLGETQIIVPLDASQRFCIGMQVIGTGSPTRSQNIILKGWGE